MIKRCRCGNEALCVIDLFDNDEEVYLYHVRCFNCGNESENCYDEYSAIEVWNEKCSFTPIEEDIRVLIEIVEKIFNNTKFHNEDMTTFDFERQLERLKRKYGNI